MLTAVLIVSFVSFAVAYFTYGKFLNKRYDINDDNPTPSHSDYDGIDRIPANKAILFGHHFSSIAGAGPVVGPIIAATAFGWLPVFIWIIIGTIFIGGVHDFSSLIASIRHKARSVAEIAKEYLSPLAYKLMLAFIWLSLIYVLTVFCDLTATTFVNNGAVTTSAIIFVILAIGLGVTLYKLKIHVLPATLIFVPLVFAAIWFGYLAPIPADKIPTVVGNDPIKTWNILLLIYCFIASTTPVWILLQPRDYLSSFLLYAGVIGGFIGILFGGLDLNFPALKTWSDPTLGNLFPILFITVACGACSGFHSIVASGTTSKQLSKESDARPIGYGAMIIEGIVAVISLAAVAMLATNDDLLTKSPITIYGAGMGKFLSVFGIPEDLGKSFGLLALSTFLLTTLDTATRLCRYIFEEFFNLKNTNSRYFSTIMTLILPTIFVLITLKDPDGNTIPAWKAIWPVFGATNQLLAGLVLLVIAVWLKKIGKKISFIIIPIVFMNFMTIWALILLIKKYGFSTIGIIAAILLVLALILMLEVVRTFTKKSPAPAK